MNTNYLTSGKAPARAGNSHQNLTPYQVFKVADGYVIVAVGNDGQFARYCQAGGRPELASDPRFRTNPDRVRNRAGMIPLLEVMMLEKTRQQWIDELEAVGVPCGPINSIADAFDNPQVKARGLKIELAHPTAGKVPLVANPIKYSGTPLEYAAPPPLLGEHTEAVLRELGYAPEQIARMRERFIV
jgi:crotonobetainyl-CoA:carnitine CoA-transferase CaiB-like acyl-CoA transferase